MNELHPGPTATAMHGVMQRDVKEIDITDHPMKQRGRDGDWFKIPEVVSDLAVFVAKFPNHGPTGQIFSLTSLR